ncbi:hypothetical protein NUU61_001350 [Penicillium alfredii]|uniref:ATP-dependent DNA helicase n=1 Tax=Penicillium alfredii TaxID=1506179 RepID=A0A9W9KMJ7_9EURO|nr:uncharacterized protein NUU61_001350 [Penicillium alfredii]KAJ5111720.1 hypothetical protein NUU61_001350 [Penicillium alfredii]
MRKVQQQTVIRLARPGRLHATQAVLPECTARDVQLRTAMELATDVIALVGFDALETRFPFRRPFELKTARSAPWQRHETNRRGGRHTGAKNECTAPGAELAGLVLALRMTEERAWHFLEIWAYNQGAMRTLQSPGIVINLLAKRRRQKSVTAFHLIPAHLDIIRNGFADDVVKQASGWRPNKRPTDAAARLADTTLHSLIHHHRSPRRAYRPVMRLPSYLLRPADHLHYFSRRCGVFRSATRLHELGRIHLSILYPNRPHPHPSPSSGTLGPSLPLSNLRPSTYWTLTYSGDRRWRLGIGHSMHIKDDICRRCRHADTNQDIFLFSEIKNMQPDPMSDLPPLTQTEEMLISRVHVFIEVRQHLLKYKDGRFGCHPRFRYVAFNTLMRPHASARSGFYVKQRGQQHDDALLRSIIRFSGTLRDTRPFWGVHINGMNPSPNTGPLSRPKGPRFSYPPRSRPIRSATYPVSSIAYSGTSALRDIAFDEATLGKPISSSYYRLFPQRNDAYLNAYNRLITLLEYLAKYITKTETKTDSYQTMMRGLIGSLNRQHPLLSAVNKPMNALVGECDWSAQEVCHILLDIPLQHGSRPVMVVDCRPPSDQSIPFVIMEQEGETSAVRRGQSLLQKYQSRIQSLDSATYLEFLRRCDRKRRSASVRQRDRVFSFYPVYDPERDPENFGRVKVMPHHPFRSLTDLLSLDGQLFESFAAAAFNYYAQAHIHEPDPYGEVDNPLPEQLFEEIDLDDDDDDDDDVTPSWELLARQLPREDDNLIRVEDPDLLGERDIDREYDWTRHIGKYPDIDPDYWRQMKAQYPADLAGRSDASVADLNEKQRQLYDIIIDHYRQVLAVSPDRDPMPSYLSDLLYPPSPFYPIYPAQLLINLDGKAGTGKSFVIMLISATLDRMAEAAGEYAKLTPENLSSLQATFRGVHYMIIDEKSMIGLRQIFWIDHRGREICPRCGDQPFGGLNIVLAGDYFQFPPVLQRPLYFNEPLSHDFDLRGRVFYHGFKTTIELATIFRREGNDPTSVAFRDALNHLREECLSADNWKLLTSRIQNNIPSEIPRFADTTRIYPKREQVRQYNHNRLRDLQQPVLRVTATHTGLKADEASTDEAGNPLKELHISIGCRVMLTENVWTEQGLVNGAFGTVRDIVWPASTVDHAQEQLSALLIEFDNYTGPTFRSEPRYIPILPYKREYSYGNITCTRTQFPLTLAYGITIHKSQGLTVNQAVLNISAPDFAAGLSYVAVSRVKRLDGILFEEPFDYECFRRTRLSATMKMRMADRERRESQHYEPVDLPPISSIRRPTFSSRIPIRSSPIPTSSSRWSTPRRDRNGR